MNNWIFIVCLVLYSCNEKDGGHVPLPTTNVKNADQFTPHISISQDQYFDQILGCLVGSAIGDAMGSPIEMWEREMIQDEYGFVDDLKMNQRLASAEGPWVSYMKSGTTTDDTRWKVLMSQYLLRLPQSVSPDARSFAQFISNEYDNLKQQLIEKDGLEAENLTNSTRYLFWLQEWAKVSEAYLTEDLDAYRNASSQFYGGEMSCAGMLYAPLVGLLYPTDPIMAYQKAWDIGLFDIGYARDLSSLTAAITAAAFDFSTPLDSLLRLHYAVDPQEYLDSRLIGRLALGIYSQARSNSIDSTFDHALTQALPNYFVGDTSKYLQLLKTYDAMTPHLKSISFHADEIYRITLNALMFSKGDFMDAMVFVINYGRDNDTSGALVGAILGTHLGYSKLPDEMKASILKANKEELNIDLKDLATQLSNKYYNPLWHK